MQVRKYWQKREQGKEEYKAGNYQPNSLFPPRLCIGHLGVSLEEKQSPTKDCLE